MLVCGLVLLSELRPLFTAGSRDANGLVLSTTLVFALLLRYGLPAALLLQVLATLIGDLSKRKAAWKVASTSGSTPCRGWPPPRCSPCSGTPAAVAPGGSGAGSLLAAAPAAVAYFVVNELLVTWSSRCATATRLAAAAGGRRATSRSRPAR